MMSVAEEFAAADSARPKRQRLTLDQRMARVEAQRQKLAAQMQQNHRKLETRRKIVIGAAVLNAMEQDDAFREQICRLLRASVIRPIDRETIAPWLSPTLTSP